MANHEEEELDIMIREAETTDARALTGLLNHVGRETDFLVVTRVEDIEQERKLINRYKESNRDIFLVIEADEQLIGMANLATLNNEKQAHVGEFGMAIIEEYWGYGLGSMLLNELIEFSKNNRVKVLNLEVISSNERAVNLYKKFNFSVVGTLSKRAKIGYKYHDVYIMELVL